MASLSNSHTKSTAKMASEFGTVSVSIICLELAALCALNFASAFSVCMIVCTVGDAGATTGIAVSGEGDDDMGSAGFAGISTMPLGGLQLEYL